MDPRDFQASPAGRCIQAGRYPYQYWAFVPNPLPPQIAYDVETIRLLEEASHYLGVLNGVGRLLPNPRYLIRPFVRREAVLSSRIEGTQASLSDLFLFEAAESARPHPPDVREILNYVHAFERGLQRIKELPLSLRLVRELHAILLKGVRGKEQTPGEFRRSQNWIGPPACTLGEASFVPPPVDEMHAALAAWEQYLHSEDPAPLLVRCALMHHQFAAIHPFLDGNGRLGRLLIAFFLNERGYLEQPLLYLSAFFERHRDEYYRRLLLVSQKGDWIGWIHFFLRGVISQAKDAMDRADRIIRLQAEYRSMLQEAKASSACLRLLDLLFETGPFLRITLARQSLGVAHGTARNAMLYLQAKGIVSGETGRVRNRFFCAQELLRLLEEPSGTG